MVSLISASKAQKIIAENMRSTRLSKGLTQEGLADRSGVALASLRKFEQKGEISFASFCKLAMVLDCLEELIKAVAIPANQFASMDDVLHKEVIKKSKRGWRK